MITTYTIFDKKTGAIEKVFKGQDYLAKEQLNNQLDLIPGEYSGYYQYYDLKNRMIKNKTNIPYSLNKHEIVSDGHDECIFFLPKNLNINIKIVTFTPGKQVKKTNVIDGELVFTTNVSGVYYFELQALNYLPTDIQIKAT